MFLGSRSGAVKATFPSTTDLWRGVGVGLSFQQRLLLLAAEGRLSGPGRQCDLAQLPKGQSEQMERHLCRGRQRSSRDHYSPPRAVISCSPCSTWHRKSVQQPTIQRWWPESHEKPARRIDPRATMQASHMCSAPHNTSHQTKSMCNLTNV